jgi:GPI-anchor transamidase subunit GAA1
MASPALPNFNPARLRSYILRLPLFTRICMVAILVFWITELQTGKSAVHLREEPSMTWSSSLER